ncbi:imelysin family protein [Polaribacter sp. M15]
MKKIVYVFLISLVFLIAYACSETNIDENINEDDFDRTTLTASWVNNLLSPAINDYQTKVEILNDAVVTFTNAPNATSLAKVRTDLFETAKVWQHVELFFYGTSFARDMNSYPADLERINTNLNSTVDINFDRTLLDTTQGLPALDYLVNGLETTDEALVVKYQDEKYANYIKALTARMLSLTDSIIAELEIEKDANINSVDNTISSYFSIQVNDYVQYTEKNFREKKIATPSGTRNRQANISVNPSPEFVESLYSPENSKALYLEAYDAIQDFYYGRNYSTNANTVGLQEYLEFLGTTIMVDGTDISLNDYIETLFDNIDAANNNIGNNFFEQTQDYNPNFDAVFDAIQEFVIAVKGNVINAFNLTIDFVDSDGD